MTDPTAGTTISVRTRRDVVITDPTRFMAAARQAYQDLNPDATDADTAIGDLHDAAYALIARDGRLAADDEMDPSTRLLPGDRHHDRPDGLSPAGMITEVRVAAQPLQDYGCSLPDDLFAP